MVSAVRVPETVAWAVVSVPLMSTLVVLIVPSTVASPVIEALPMTVKFSTVSATRFDVEIVDAHIVPVVVKPVAVMVPVLGSDFSSLLDVKLKFPSLN